MCSKPLTILNCSMGLFYDKTGQARKLVDPSWILSQLMSVCVQGRLESCACGRIWLDGVNKADSAQDHKSRSKTSQLSWSIWQTRGFDRCRIRELATVMGNNRRCKGDMILFRVLLFGLRMRFSLSTLILVFKSIMFHQRIWTWILVNLFIEFSILILHQSIRHIFKSNFSLHVK